MCTMLATCLVFLWLVVAIRAEVEGYIVGGSLASIISYPHSAFLMIRCAPYDENTSEFICGSSILTQEMLLTAAHCVHACSNGTKIVVSMGHEERMRGVLRSASNFMLHRKYNPFKNYADIALVKMGTPVKFSLKIRKVTVMQEPPYNEMAYLAGWGVTNEITKAEGFKLKHVAQKVWKRAACQQIIGLLPSGTICASSKKRDEFPSYGDSGSALIVRGHIQIGLISYKTPRLADNVIVYTDVGYYYKWIVYNARMLSS